METYVTVGLDASRGLWLAVVWAWSADERVLLTCGYESTKDAAIEWGELAAEAQPWIDGNPCPPDIYDRGELPMLPETSH